MIGIKLDGDNDFLELPPDVSITVKLENPILSDDDRISPGSYSLDFNIPGGEKSPSNAARLKNPDVIENTEAYQIQKATLFASGDISSNVIPFKKGNLRTQSSDKDDINSFFTFGLNSISKEFKTAKLRDVIAENFIIGSSAITKKIYLKRIGAGDYNITVNGQTYSGASVLDLQNAINVDSDASIDSGKYVPYATHITSGSTPSGLITSTYLEIKLVLHYTYHDPTLGMDFHLTQDAVDPLLELWVNADVPVEYQVESDLGTYFTEYDTFLASYLSGAYPNDKIRFPVCFNATPYAETLKDGQIVNGRNTAGFIMNDPNWGLNNSLFHNRGFKIKNYNSLQPFLRRKWILDKIAETFGFAWDGDFYNHTDVENMLESNAAALDFPQQYIGETKFVFWKRRFNLSELIPDITVVEYLKRIKSRYNLASYYNEITQRVTLEFREPIARSTQYDDITSISTPLNGNEEQRATGFRLICKKDDTDLFSQDEVEIIGTPEDDIEIECGRLFSTSLAIIDGKQVTGPAVSQKFGEKGQLRTFYYKESLTNVTSFSYCAADINGETIYEGLNNFFFFTGLYENYWKYWIQSIKTRKSVKVKSSFPLRQLVAVLWKLKRRYNRSNYLVKSIDLKISNEGTDVTSVELYTMK